MYRPLCYLIALFCLLAAGPVRAVGVTATVDGMRITATAPWYPHGFSDPARVSIKRMHMDERGGEIHGEGAARVYPLPDRETL